MSVCAKFQLSSWSRSGWKVCGSGVGNTWLPCLTPTLVSLELFWVGLSYVGFWQKDKKFQSLCRPVKHPKKTVGSIIENFLSPYSTLLWNNTVPLFSAPLRVYGSGKYSLTSIKEIDGTEQYLIFAEKEGKCQNKESQESCLAREYLREGLEQCSCIPYKLREIFQFSPSKSPKE